MKLRMLDFFGATGLILLAALKVHGVATGAVASVSIFTSPSGLLGVAAVEAVVGVATLFRRHTLPSAVATVGIGLAFLIATYVSKEEPRSCGCLGAIQIAYSQRLAIGGAILLIGSLRLMLSSVVRPNANVSASGARTLTSSSPMK